ncbi:MAG: type II toxin-antitoxin system mRNA interferase toxin, RelE/StbE family [Planctomycetia bacterium]|nr:type II toxin-antitoxin system mRNA interferase toxin, RelE/StbE family [Planctomycetia bacterium]
MKRAILQSKSFARASKAYLKTHPKSADAIEDVLNLLAADAYDPRLRTHKLQGRFDGYWSCSAGYDLRVLFQFVTHNGEETILLLSLGTHDEVY